MKTIPFSPTASGLLLISLLPAILWPVPVIFFYALVSVCFLKGPGRASVAPLGLALFPRLGGEITFTIGLVTLSIGLQLLLFRLRDERESASPWRSIFSPLGALCLFLPILAIARYPDPLVEFSDRWLFEGQIWEVERLPRYFFFRWLSITTPLFLQFTSLLGFIGILAQYKKYKIRQKHFLSLLILQLLVLFTIATISPSSNLRHSYNFLVIYDLSLLSSLGVIWLFDTVKNRHVKYLLYTYFLIQLLPVLLDINALYPYQGSYFNRTYGGLKVARAKQEIYPRLEEGVKWLEAKIPPGAVIEIPGRSPTGNSPVGGERATGTGGYYKVVNVTGDYLDPRPDCVTVHSIYRQKTPLILIKKC